MVFSSKKPHCPPRVIAWWLAMTWAQTWIRASAMTGLTFPGMIEEPGCTSGRSSSKRPARGPEPSQRMSLAIFIRETATVLSTPPAATTRVHRRLGLEVVLGLAHGDSGQGLQAGADAGRRTPGGR